MYAAAQNHAACVRLLLEAGADPDPQLKGLQMQRGSPLNCAARIASDPLVLKTLLDFGADVESCGAEGRTSLLHAARSDNIDFAILLLDYGANINATTSTGQTALTTTITHNSHNVLRLLLDRWQEFSSCPRLKGPHLLQVTATYADLETIRILACVDHFAISYDRTYTHGDFESRLRQRPFVDAGLADGFAELLSVIDSCPTAQEAKETLLETGLLLRDANQDQDSDEERFEDAKELLEPAV